MESFFHDQHCTRFGDAVSQFRTIMASVIHGSGIGPVSFVVTASDLHPITPGNFMIKYADDTYVMINNVKVLIAWHKPLSALLPSLVKPLLLA